MKKMNWFNLGLCSVLSLLFITPNHADDDIGDAEFFCTTDIIHNKNYVEYTCPNDWGNRENDQCVNKMGQKNCVGACTCNPKNVSAQYPKCDSDAVGGVCKEMSFNPNMCGTNGLIMSQRTGAVHWGETYIRCGHFIVDGIGGSWTGTCIQPNSKNSEDPMRPRTEGEHGSNFRASCCTLGSLNKCTLSSQYIRTGIDLNFCWTGNIESNSEGLQCNGSPLNM